jgi:S1-C subfamily serine protease
MEQEKLSRRDIITGLAFYGLVGAGVTKLILGRRTRQLVVSPNIQYGASPINSSRPVYSPNTILINRNIAVSPPYTQQQSIEALSQVFDSSCACTPEQSVKNIFDNLVHVYLLKEAQPDGSQQRIEGTGQRITTDGWVLTSYHAIKEFLPRLKAVASTAPARDFYEWSQKVAGEFYVEGHDCVKYALDPSVIAFNTSFDIALIKTYSNEIAKPISFLTRTRPPSKGERTEIYVYEKDNFVRSFGEVDLENQVIENSGGIFYDCFSTTSKSSPGYSGGSVINPDTGEYIGMAIAGGDYIEFTTCAKARNLVSLVQETAQRLRTK